MGKYVWTFVKQHVMLQKCYKLSWLNMQLFLYDKNQDAVLWKQRVKHN